MQGAVSLDFNVIGIGVDVHCHCTDVLRASCEFIRRRKFDSRGCYNVLIIFYLCVFLFVFNKKLLPYFCGDFYEVCRCVVLINSRRVKLTG